MMRLLCILALLVGLFPAPAYAQVPDEISLPSYLTTPGDDTCANDVTVKVRQAFTDAVMASVARSGGTLRLGAGCYLINGAIVVQRTDNPNAGYSLNVVGEGPENTIFRAGQYGFGWVLKFNELSGGHVSGFTVEGPGTAGLRGLTFSSAHSDLGSCCFVLEDTQVRNFAYCYMFGDDSSPYGAAADVVVISATASNCSNAYSMYGANTIGIHYIHSSATDSSVGWQTSGGSGQAQQISWIGGGGVNLGTTFALWGNGTFSIANFRDEPRARTTPRITGGSGGGGTWYIQQYTAVDWQGPISITSNGGVAMHLIENFLVGQVQITGAQNGIIGTIDSSQNKLYTSAASPWLVPQGARIRSWGDCKPDVVFAQCLSYWS